MLTPATCIVIPCYNEQNGITMEEYSRFLNDNPDVYICFVNDGSTDRTQDVLELLKEQHPGQIFILTNEKNSGKAETVRIGINFCNRNFNHRHIGFLDADLSATLQEFISMRSYLKGNISFCFGSRIMKIGSNIVRQTSRFLVGRLIATLISNLLRLKVYDTQCGCKIFTTEISVLLFRKKFISRWLFDVELFYRMIILFGKDRAIEKMYELPLRQWIEKGNSKVRFTYFFVMWLDLYEIAVNYKRHKQQYI